SSSTYGPSHWDDDCTTATDPVHVTAQMWTRRGRVYVDFSPALRFSPDVNVTIMTRLPLWANTDDLAANPHHLRPFRILYSPGRDQGSVDEVSTMSDWSLATHVDLSTRRVWRRIKHFSGYNYAAGVECDPTSGDPDCVDVDVIPGK